MKKTLIVLLILVSVMLTGCGSRSADSITGRENGTTQSETKEKVVIAC